MTRRRLALAGLALWALAIAGARWQHKRIQARAQRAVARELERELRTNVGARR